MLPINVVVEILRQALDFTAAVVSKFDDEKYAKAVTEIYGHEPDYSELDTLSKVIANAADIDTERKSELLLALADKRTEVRRKEFEIKKGAAKTATKAFEKKCKCVGKLALGIFSGGITLLPDLYYFIEEHIQDKPIIEPRSK